MTSPAASWMRDHPWTWWSVSPAPMKTRGGASSSRRAFTPTSIHRKPPGGSRLDPVVVITEGVPVHDALQIVEFARRQQVHLVGPNCPGLTVPGQCKIGIMPNHLFAPGPVGVVSRSGTLTYEIVAALTRDGIGQSMALGLGGDPVVGLSFTDALRMFQDDPHTAAVILIGEIGGSAEEEAARFISAHVRKPVVGYIAGRTAPPASGWDTPAPSSPARRARPAQRSRRCRRPG